MCYTWHSFVSCISLHLIRLLCWWIFDVTLFQALSECHFDIWSPLSSRYGSSLCFVVLFFLFPVLTLILLKVQTIQLNVSWTIVQFDPDWDCLLSSDECLAVWAGEVLKQTERALLAFSLKTGLFFINRWWSIDSCTVWPVRLVCLLQHVSLGPECLCKRTADFNLLCLNSYHICFCDYSTNHWVMSKTSTRHQRQTLVCWFSLKQKTKTPECLLFCTFCFNFN